VVGVVGALGAAVGLALAVYSFTAASSAPPQFNTNVIQADNLGSMLDAFFGTVLAVLGGFVALLGIAARRPGLGPAYVVGIATLALVLSIVGRWDSLTGQTSSVPSLVAWAALWLFDHWAVRIVGALAFGLGFAAFFEGREVRWPRLARVARRPWLVSGAVATVVFVLRFLVQDVPHH
jgi:hypothetical protein